MNVNILFVAFVITFLVLLGVQLVTVKTSPEKSREIERNLEQLCCVIYFSLPIAISLNEKKQLKYFIERYAIEVGNGKKYQMEISYLNGIMYKNISKVEIRTEKCN